MAPLDILGEVRRKPFEPFQLILADGARFEIQHPDQCMVTKKAVVIGEVSPESGVIDWTISISPHNVARIEREPVGAVA